jgi:putative ABC transport system substrate-binding protein
MTRRQLITLFGLVVALRPFGATAQKLMPVIGYINGATPDDSADLVAAFRDGLREAGYVEGQNVAIEYGWAEDHYDRLPTLANNAVNRHVAIIAATSTPVALAAQKATTTIPIAFTVGGDPVKIGLVSSLNHPGGNLTGVTRFNVELAPKRLELLHELVPTVTVAALLVNPTNPNTPTVMRDLEAASRVIGMQIRVFQAETDDEIDAVFKTLVQLRVGALVIANDPFFNSRSEKLAELTVRSAIPAIYQYRSFVEAGGLLSYGASNTDSHHQLGHYVGRILAGEKPDDLPVQQSTKVDLIINLKTAKSFGLTVSQLILARADEVIE